MELTELRAFFNQYTKFIRNEKNDVQSNQNRGPRPAR